MDVLGLCFGRRKKALRRESQVAPEAKLDVECQKDELPEIKAKEAKNAEATPRCALPIEDDDDDLESHISDPPMPYEPPEDEHEPPSYHAYNSQETHPEFPRKAIAFALRDSQPPQPFNAEHLDIVDRKETEGEQGQFFNSIQYGDQLNRGLDELSRFQEDRMKEVVERSGLTAEEIDRRGKLAFWDNDVDEWDKDERDEISDLD